MKILTILALMMAAASAKAQADAADDVFAGMGADGKGVVVAVHLGTDDRTERARCIDALNARLRATFPGRDVREAWTSRKAIAALRRGGEEMPTPDALLADLARDGYTHVLVQPSFTAEGDETAALRAQVAAQQQAFREVRVGAPLMACEQDCADVLRAVAATRGQDKAATLLAADGEADDAQPYYALLDYTMRGDTRYKGWQVAATAGFPSIGHAVARMRAEKTKRAVVVPLTLACDSVSRRLLAEEWTVQLRHAGIKAEVAPHSLGENSAVLDILVRHARHAQTHRVPTPLERKLARHPDTDEP